MAFFDPMLEQLGRISPRGLKQLTHERLSTVVLKEMPRARKRIDELIRRYPSAGTKELAQRLIDSKKGLAGVMGGVSGVFGLVSVPADLVVIAWLQITLLVDIATLYKTNLKPDHARKELLDLYGYATGLGPMTRSGPRVLGTVAAKLLQRGGLLTLGKAVPLVAAPISAYLNSTHLQQVGDEAVRHYEGFGKAQEKTRRAASE